MRLAFFISGSPPCSVQLVCMCRRPACATDMRNVGIVLLILSQVASIIPEEAFIKDCENEDEGCTCDFGWQADFDGGVGLLCFDVDECKNPDECLEDERFGPDASKCVNVPGDFWCCALGETVNSWTEGIDPICEAAAPTSAGDLTEQQFQTVVILATTIPAVVVLWICCCVAVYLWYKRNEKRKRKNDNESRMQSEISLKQIKTSNGYDTDMQFTTLASAGAGAEAKAARPDLSGYDDDDDTFGEEGDKVVELGGDATTRSTSLEILLRELVAGGKLREVKLSDISDVEDVIGEGSFKVVVKASLSGQGSKVPVAVSLLKIRLEAHLTEADRMDLTAHYRSEFLSEAYYNIKLHLHPNIVTIRGVCFDNLKPALAASLPHVVKANPDL